MDQYLSQELGDYRFKVIPQSPNPHLNDIIQLYKNNYSVQDRKITIIYDENISLSEKLWLFDRRVYYHAIPSLTTAQFKYLIKTRGLAALSGYEFYFIEATKYTSLNQYFSTPDALVLESFLKNDLKLSPVKIIYGYSNLPMLIVYKFSL